MIAIRAFSFNFSFTTRIAPAPAATRAPRSVVAGGFTVHIILVTLLRSLASSLDFRIHAVAWRFASSLPPFRTASVSIHPFRHRTDKAR